MAWPQRLGALIGEQVVHVEDPGRIERHQRKLALACALLGGRASFCRRAIVK